MYSSSTNNSVKMIDTHLVNKILEQGQKLRNAMVGSILKNDPFNTDIIYNKQFNTPLPSNVDLNSEKVSARTTFDEKIVESYIKGECMTKEEEKLALETLRSMSAPDLCRTTERTLNSPCLSNCHCYTCEIYNTKNLYCDLRRRNVNNDKPTTDNEVTKDIRQKYQNKNKNLLQYVDSLKISTNNLILNESGNQKVSHIDKKVPYVYSQSYFLEYGIPESIIDKNVSKSKVNSGLENNYVRFCSRRNNDTINFKQITVHDVKNMDKINLDNCYIKFKISFRAQKQKNASILGIAKFNLGSFLLSKNLVCHRSLPVFISENSPIVVGHLKVSFLLGCGRLYFGQDFIDAINSVERNSVVLDSDDSTSRPDVEEHNGNILEYENIHTDKGSEVGQNIKTLNSACKNSVVTKKSDKGQDSDVSNLVSKRPKKSDIVYGMKNSNIENIKVQSQNTTEFKSNESNLLDLVKTKKFVKPQISDNEKQILFGFLYISEVQYLSPPINSFITCQPFCQNETSCSKLVTNTSNPVFNFAQLVPLIYEDQLLQLLRENYMVIEFWRKINSTDLIIGLTKISLHQFYLAYRNPIFVKYLSKNKQPIIDTDWWEPICSTDTEEILGQVQVLVALGTEEQINNLKSERGFTNNNIQAKFPVKESSSKVNARFQSNPHNSIPQTKNKESNKKDCLQSRKPTLTRNDVTEENNSRFTRINTEENLSWTFKEKPKFVDKAVNTTLSTKNVQFTIEKLDIGTQSTLEMDKPVEKTDKDNISPTQEMLGNFLKQLMAEKQKNIYVENSTNTETLQTDRSKASQSIQNAQNNTNLELRKTTDLLDSLQKALYLDGTPSLKAAEKKPGTFRASILINSANHLPSRKKCKSKKSRSKSIKNDDSVLPSCYVTFETHENDLQITPVVSKSTTPVWNYKCSVNLSEDLLTNGQRRLIFKVWRKATNAVLSPNMQTDVVLGFAAVDLTVLLAGFPNVQGWFNIIDFMGKCNGQINIHITPLENLSQYTIKKDECSCNIPNNNSRDESTIEDEPSEIFSRALKRKFTELDEITQRLRLRLSKVTNEESDSSNDDVADDFERDINTLCIEDDFDLIDFEEEARKLNSNKNSVKNKESSTSDLETLLTIQGKDCGSNDKMQVVEEVKNISSNTATSLSASSGNLLKLGNNSDKEKELSALNKHLQEGKQKIDTLLEKLSLISADTNNTFASRYVSGCSLSNECNALNIDTEAILKELDHSSRPNIQSSLGFEPLKFQQLYGSSISSNSSKTGGSSSSNSDTSLITNFSENRPAPDGQGNIIDDNVGISSNI